jgi:hypothetical protein
MLRQFILLHIKTYKIICDTVKTVRIWHKCAAKYCCLHAFANNLFYNCYCVQFMTCKDTVVAKLVAHYFLYLR